MTVTEADEIFRYWERHPPAHLMVQIVARMLGWTPVSDEARPPIDDLAAAAPPGIAVVKGADPALPPADDIEALRAENRARALAIARRNRDAATR